jgi:nucleoside phosphorylase
VDDVVLTAIELEYAAVKQVEAGAAPDSRWIEEKHNGLPVALREFVTSKGGRLQIAAARAPDMGKGSAVATLAPLVDALRPSCIAMCGVCAGRPGKTALGDIVVDERLYDYDAGKWKESLSRAVPKPSAS